MAGESDDELARTATAPGSRSTAVADVPADVGGALGRYRLERELGAGGMGVVHAAFDPDLERRVALKVLRAGSAGSEAQRRLLREARAMARLAHGNVVTVHEVGSANGRDYIAMELIEGDTLVDWLRAAPRGEAAIVDAFLAAGRGLAAAHRAGIVHRDFKPHNVLRSAGGRIVVTDFGLARDAQLADAKSKAPSLAMSAGDSGLTALAGLTVTGSLLGTPAYMAPEQWSGGAVTPATDQFAYAVALWEALAGERPFRGLSLEELRASVLAGPDALDASKIPRRLRPILRRGLQPDPKQRWPDMDALLDALVRAERRPALAFVVLGGMIAAGIAALVILRATANGCPAPVLSPASVWSPDLAAEIRARSAPTAALFDGDFAAWQALRGKTCKSDAPDRPARLACLDGVLARFDAVRRAALLPPQPLVHDWVAAELVMPSVCDGREAPRLATRYSAAAVTGLALQRVPDDAAAYPEDVEAKALADAAGDPCARGQIELARVQYGKTARARQALDSATEASDACGDERLRVEVMVWAMWYRLNEFLDPRLPNLVQALKNAVARVSQPDLEAAFASLQSQIARTLGRTDEALGYLASAIEGYGARRPRGQLLAVKRRVDILLSRSGPGDRAQAAAELAKWTPLAKQEGDTATLNAFARADAAIEWLSGDTAAADAKLAALPPDPAELPKTDEAPPLSGTVVDREGRPVAGATVVTGVAVNSDATTLGLRLGPAGLMQHTVSGPDGSFAFPAAPEHGVVGAQLGALRSLGVPAKAGARLVLVPTGRVEGSVEMDRNAIGSAVVVAYSSLPGTSPLYQIVAPVVADGSFVLDGVPRGPIKIGIAINSGAGQTLHARDLTVGASTITGVSLSPAGGRPLRVLVRSDSQVPLTGAIVIVAPGRVDIHTTADLSTRVLSVGGVASETARAVLNEPPPEVVPSLHPGDLLASFSAAPVEGTVCAFGIQGDLSDPSFVAKLQRHLSDLKVSCQPLAASTAVVSIEVPPMKRLD